MTLTPVNFSDKNASSNFIQSLKSSGFALIKDHPISSQLIYEVFNEWKRFFASEYKSNYIYNKDTQDGFFPLKVSETQVGYSEKDLKEYYHYFLWGQFPTEISILSKILFEQMTNIALTLLSWIEDSLPELIKGQLSQPLSAMIENSKRTLMRIIHYPPLNGNESQSAIRAAPHTDINLLTILAATSSGLQIFANSEWSDVLIEEGMLVVNIGDMLQELTGGFYKSTKHQVINPLGIKSLSSRYSIPLFLHARPEVILSKRYTVGSYYYERLSQLRPIEITNNSRDIFGDEVVDRVLAAQGR